MGVNILDQYSLLHLASGIVAYFWGVNFKLHLILHIIFELLENSSIGICIINRYIYKYTPMNKTYPDYPINIIGDIISGVIGWLLAYYLDKMGNDLGWYYSNIK